MTPPAQQKSESAFRTISEVADDLNVQQHVLRFWETKFSQIKPLKRGGGRRYYRPEDVALLKRIHSLLYVEGYTIKGVQKLLKGVSKSQVLEEQRAGRSPDVAQAYGSNLPQVQGPAATSTDPSVLEAPTSLEFAEGDGNASGYEAEQDNGAPRLSSPQTQALQAVLNELMDMRNQLRALTGEAATDADQISAKKKFNAA